MSPYLTICQDQLGASSTNINNRCFDYIAAAKHLKELQVRSCDITDEALKGIARLPRLESLSLILCHGISDIGIYYISHLQCLRRLLLSYCEGLTDLALWYIGKLPLLEELDMSCPAFTDAGLMHLSGSEHLHKIGYDYENDGQVTEAGREKAGLPVFWSDVW